MTCEHDWQPVEKMRAVYRCPACGQIGHKAVARIGFGAPGITPYICHHQPCDQPVTKLFPVVRARKRWEPSCELHRKDRT